MKITAVNFSGPQLNIINNTLAQIDSASVNPVPITSAQESVGLEDVIIFYWDGDSNMGLTHIKEMREALSFKDVPLILVCEKKPDFIDKAMTSGASKYLTIPLDAELLKKTVENAVKPVGSIANGVNVEFVNPFIQSTVDVLQTMAQAKSVSRKALYLKKDYNMFGDISGVMGLSGKAVGSVVVTLPENLAAKLVASMLGMDANGLAKEEIHDGVGELINMISGKAKAELANTDYQFVISLPTIVAGHGHEIVHKTGTPCIVIIMEADGQEFALQISLAADKS